MHGLYRRKGNETWYILLYHEGKRVRASTGTANKKEAQKFYDKFCADLRAQTRAANTTTWQDACVKWLKAEDRSANDRYILRALDYADRPLADCTPESFEPALEHLSNATYNRYRAIIVAVCNLSGHKLKLPTKKVKRGRLRFLTKEEWERLYAELQRLRDVNCHLLTHYVATKQQSEATHAGLDLLLGKVEPDPPPQLTRRRLK